jgi:hypothetical protein
MRNRLLPRLADNCSHGLDDSIRTLEGDPVPTVMDNDQATARRETRQRGLELAEPKATVGFGVGRREVAGDNTG